MITVLMITYKHDLFIAKAIEGVLAQKTDFPVHLIIADDASPDNTEKIVCEYLSRYPQQIRYIRNESNLGMMKNFVNIFSHSKDKYIALCEGDDYWCDENKLQKQVDFLEANPNYALCFHRVYELYDGKKPLLSIANPPSEETYDISTLAEGNFIYTASVVYRNHLFNELPKWFIESPVGDYPLFMLIARYGLIKYFPNPMAVYRIHNGGVWSTLDRNIRLKKGHRTIELLFNADFDPDILKKLDAQKGSLIENYLKTLMKEPNWETFLAELSTYAKNDSDIANKWLIHYYPKYIRSIKNSKGYRFSAFIRKWYYKLKW